ncbi:MAG: SagB/ThcOx family dehydrogenase [Lachnospiraceae bacterium]|nr:SagB/ThcOx family dehydrogenase [Lachnospiraceae bacterium]
MEKKLFWSPGATFRVENGVLWIDQLCFRQGAELFPEFYYVTQTGKSKQEIVKYFEEDKHILVYSMIRELLKRNVLITHIPSLKELFYGLHTITDTIKKEELLLKKEAFLDFQKQQSCRIVRTSEDVKMMQLQKETVENDFCMHETTRSFDTTKMISFYDFSKILSVFRVRQERNFTRFYPSAGGLYPIDIYIYVKHDRVENVEEGFYYYAPTKNGLSKLDNKQELTEQVHYMTNRDIFLKSAVTMFFVYNGKTNIPKYGNMGYAFGLLDAGIMTEVLYTICNKMQIGACSIGDMDFEQIARLLDLPAGEVPIHAIELGLKKNEYQ